MDRVERFLTDPTPAALGAALAQAQSACPGLGQRDWAPAAAEAFGLPEGTRWYPLARVDPGALREGAVFQAWWTDRVGVRHHRVVGVGSFRNTTVYSHPRHRDRGGAWNDGRPPLWHICPGRVVGVGEGPGQVWQVVCPCGASGPPDRLGWRGDCCGPCFDRRLEEGAPPDRVVGPAVELPGGGVDQLAFDRAGASLSVGQFGRGVTRWDLGRGSLESEGRRGQQGFAQSRDRDLWVGIWASRREVRLASLGGEFPDQSFAVADCLAAAVSPDGRTLAAGTSLETLVWRRGDEGWRVTTLEGGAAGFAFSPDGRWLAVGGNSRLYLVDAPTLTHRRCVAEYLPGERVFAFHPAGRVLAYADLRCDQLAFHDLAADGPLLPRPPLIPAPSALAFSPDGRYFAWAEGRQRSEDCVLHVLAWPPRPARPEAPRSEPRVVGTLECDRYDPVGALAFSPDGATLAVGGASGQVRLLPWRDLLPE